MDCPKGYICVDGLCVRDPDYPPDDGQTCSVDDDCPDGYICVNGRCVLDDDDGSNIGIGTIPVGIVTDIVIERPGIGYTEGDRIRIDGTDCLYQPILTENGSIIGVLNQFACDNQFTRYPDITIDTNTGSGAQAFPVTEYRPQYVIDNQDIVGLTTSIKTVIDCVGIRDLVFVGWVNGYPYYGPYHEHEGKRMVGPVHTDKRHPTIYDTKEQSLFALNVPSRSNNWRDYRNSD